MAMPLNELESQPNASSPSAAQSEPGWPDDQRLRPVASVGSGELTSGFDIGLTDQGLTQNWLRVRMHSGSASDWAPLLTSGLPDRFALEDMEARVEADGSQITVDELTRRFLKQEARAGRSPISLSIPGADGDGAGVDLGLNMVRSLLDHKMDRELALTALSHTLEIREFLLRVSASDQVRDYETVVGSNSARRSSTAAAATPQSDNSQQKTYASPELGQIQRENEGSVIDSLTEFVMEFLVDIRTIFFFGGSLFLILLLSFAVSRWSRA